MQGSLLREWLLKVCVAFAFVAVFLSFNTDKMAIAPDNAKVYYNTATKTYAAPFCIEDDLYTNAKLARQARGSINMLLAEGNFVEADRLVQKYTDILEGDAAWSHSTTELGSLEALGYEADNDCKNSGAFAWQANALMVRLGLEDDPHSRWSIDGKWNW